MSPIRLLARPMLAAVFVWTGYQSLRDPGTRSDEGTVLGEKVAPLVAKAGVPSVPTNPRTWVRITGAVQVGAGLAFATGRAPRLSATLLAGTLLPTAVVGERFWETTDPGKRAEQKVNFVKNLALLGGLLLATVDTEGRPGVAYRAHLVGRGTRRAARVAKRDAVLHARALRSESRLARMQAAKQARAAASQAASQIHELAS